MKWEKASVKVFPELKDLRRIAKNNDAKIALLFIIDEDEISCLRYVNRVGLTKK